MKTHIGIWIFILCSSLASFAQNDPAAQQLLDQVSKKYDAYQTLQSDFNFSAKQPNGEMYTDQGTLFLNKKQSQYRIQLKNQELISDGKTTYSILKDDKEVQIADADNGSSSIGPNNLFTFYKSGFKYVSSDDERVGGELLRVVELSPLDTKNNYFKIKLRVNKNRHIHDVLIFDKSGARYTYTIKTLYVNNSISPSNFSFNKANYPNYELVDLR
ncbi:LolA family protein [Sphingobacterium griseoflavum]|nr:outer membrane lipoprotein carrier protein LolA [Sphingobacterium griseoflavum]